MTKVQKRAVQSTVAGEEQTVSRHRHGNGKIEPTCDVARVNETSVSCVHRAMKQDILVHLAEGWDIIWMVDEVCCLA